jgi:glycerate 2-kinase
LKVLTISTTKTMIRGELDMVRKFVIAPDSFKESMSAKKVCDAIEKGIRETFPDAEVIKVPMADGGEGTVQALVDATNGEVLKKYITGPLGEKVEAEYGILGDKKTAVIEMSSASGIQYVNEKTKNPLITTTYGTGELIKECLESGVENIILGLGGSATNDGGQGMAAALGVKFLDKEGNEIPLGGGYLKQLDRIDISNLNEKLLKCHIEVASDVSNPLCGENGASAIFGPQKGATPEMVKILDENLHHYAGIIKRDLGKDVIDVPSAGAAGGLGAGLIAFTNCTIQSGVKIVIKYTDLKEKLRDADYCFTGEGKIDAQTRYGKTPYGVAKSAKSVGKNIKVIALAGMIGENTEALYKEGFDAIFCIIPSLAGLDDLLKNGEENLTRTTVNITRLLM